MLQLGLWGTIQFKKVCNQIWYVDSVKKVLFPLWNHVADNLNVRWKTLKNNLEDAWKKLFTSF